MDIQYIIAALIVFGAVTYVGSMLWKKFRAFAPKSKCGDDCGCGSKPDAQARA